MGAAPSPRCEWDNGTFYINTWNSKGVPLEVTSSTTIGHMKGMLSMLTKVPAPVLTLHYCGFVMDDMKTIGEICPLKSQVGSHTFHLARELPLVVAIPV